MAAERSFIAVEGRSSPARRGVTLVELLAAFSILGVIVPVSAGLIVRHGRLLSSARNQRLAIEELSNQMERLTSRGGVGIADFVASPRPSPEVAAALPGARLSVAIDEPAGPEGARRVVLSVEWGEPGRRGNPLRLAGWLPSARSEDRP